MYKNNVTVYLGEDMDPLHYEEICESLLCLDGIIDAAHSKGRPHRMTVRYDPYKLDSLMILGRVRCFAQQADFGPAELGRSGYRAGVRGLPGYLND